MRDRAERNSLAEITKSLKEEEKGNGEGEIITKEDFNGVSQKHLLRSWAIALVGSHN